MGRDNADRDNWFLHLHYWDAHTPFRTPEGFGNPFADDPIPDWLTQEKLTTTQPAWTQRSARDHDVHQDQPQVHQGCQRRKDDGGRAKLMDGYDCGIRYMDDHVGIILNALKRRGIWDDLAIIAIADHGESMGELGLYTEHGTADELTTHVPLIVKWPGGKSGAVEDGLHYSLDLSPTLAELLGRDQMPRWDGQSYARTVRNGEDCGWEYLVTSVCAHSCQRGVRFGRGCICVPTTTTSTYGQERCCSTSSGTRTRNTTWQALSRRVQAGVLLPDGLARQMMASMPGDTDPMWTVMREGGPFTAAACFPTTAVFWKRPPRLGCA